jgi:hypothetical protein
MAQIGGSLAGGDTATQVAKSKSLSIGISGVFVAAIILLECAAIYIYLAGGRSPAKAEAHSAVAAKEHLGMRDIDLGKFSLIASDPDSRGSLLIEFHLVGSVVAARSGVEATDGAERDGFNGPSSDSIDANEDDNIAFEKLFRHGKSQFRDSVIGIIGNAQISTLSDPGFGEIKGRILAKTNSLLGKPLLKEIRFSEFAVVQQ